MQGPLPEGKVLIRYQERVPERRAEINHRNDTIRHRNRLVKAARENGKFYLEGGVLSMQ